MKKYFVTYNYDLAPMQALAADKKRSSDRIFIAVRFAIDTMEMLHEAGRHIAEITGRSGVYITHFQQV